MLHGVHQFPEVALGITGGHGFHKLTSKIVTIICISIICTMPTFCCRCENAVLAVLRSIT